MRLLHVINDLGRGGAEKLLVHTLPMYQESGVAITLLLLGGTNNVPEYELGLKENGIEVHRLNAVSLYRLSTVKLLKQFLAGKHYDLIHVHLFPAMYWLPLALSAMKSQPRLVFTEHNTQNRRWGKFYFRPVDRFFYRKYHKIIAITNEVRDGLTIWVPDVKERITVINNGIDLKQLDSILPANKAALLQELGIRDKDPFLILMAARFDRQKNHRALIETLKTLPSDFHVLLAGEGVLKEAYEQHVQELGLAERIHFLGFRTDVIALMKTVDVNVLSSNFEGLSGVTLEALASGVPFLGARVPGIEKTVPDERFLFSNNDTGELGAKIISLRENKILGKQMSEDALNFVRAFDIPKMVAAHLELYHSLTRQ
ncbi:glycosyltransferase [Taibaiella helva]|uniref:glycosyltransferase n=1 Tax=Taibaiella helva TaxID=2301235 RepID=UPI000E58F691|nr:glycosyltransferase [Taibaiella helva]